MEAFQVRRVYSLLSFTYNWNTLFKSEIEREFYLIKKYLRLLRMQYYIQTFQT